MTRKKYTLFTLLFLSLFNGFSQSNFTGKVVDTEGVTLAFVAVIPNDDATKGVLTDIEGRFSIHSKTLIQSLTFRCVGLQTLKLNADFLDKNKEKTLEITLKNANNTISEVTILAGENPADRLIRKAIAYKDRNNPEKLATFQCKTYNKVAMDMLPNDSLFLKIINKKDTSKKQIKERIQQFHKMDSQMTERHLLFMETVTERRFRYPNDNFERVLLNRVSGFPNSSMVALANMVQPFSFYGDFLMIIDKNYVNPVSKGSPSLYFFNIEDTLYQGIDTVFVLSFHPKKGRVFEGLEGVLHINSYLWAVQNVKAKPSNKANLNIKLEQQYHFDSLAQQWFPEQLNFEMSLPKYPSPYLGMQLTGRSYISDISVNLPLKQKDFNPENPLIIENKAFGQADSAWQNYRDITPLSKKENETYHWMDSLAKKNNFEFWGKIMQVLGTGKLPLKKGISLDLQRLIKFNNHEGTRLGIGFSTAPALPLQRPKFLEPGLYAGYGIRDSAFKYGAYVKFRLAQGSQTSLQFNYKKDLLEPGASSGLGSTGLVSRSLYANFFDKNEEASVSLGSRLGKRVYVQSHVTKQHLEPTYAYRFQKNETATPLYDFHFLEASIYAKYEFNAQNSSLIGENMNEINKRPVFEINYTRGFNNERPFILSRPVGMTIKALRGGYNYEKWAFAIHQTLPIRRLGRMIWCIEGGKVTGDALPFSKLFTLNQSGGGFALLALNNTFQTLTDTLWLSDKFLNIYFKQEIGHILYRFKWSQPQLSIVQNTAFQQLSHPERHVGIPFLTAKKPLLESGIVLDNLLRINYLNFAYFGIGFGTYYRWGYQASSNWRDNMSIRFSGRMSLL
jgi:Family of unknown function (DUF5686)/CarboxypepD_reg-like domain